MPVPPAADTAAAGGVLPGKIGTAREDGSRGSAAAPQPGTGAPNGVHARSPAAAAPPEQQQQQRSGMKRGFLGKHQPSTKAAADASTNSSQASRRPAAPAPGGEARPIAAPAEDACRSANGECSGGGARRTETSAAERLAHEEDMHEAAKVRCRGLFGVGFGSHLNAGWHHRCVYGCQACIFLDCRPATAGRRRRPTPPGLSSSSSSQRR